MSWPPYTRVPRLVPIRPDQARSGPIGPREAKKKINFASRFIPIYPDSSRFIPEKMYMYALCVNRMLYVYMYAPCVCCSPCSMCLSRSTNKYGVAYGWCYYAGIACIFGTTMLAPCVRQRVIFSGAAGR